MADLLPDWDSLAKDWDKWRPPLRPQRKDAEFLQGAVIRWVAERCARRVDALLLGVTHEIAVLDWPFPLDLLAVDRSRLMVELWGYTSERTEAVVGDWFNLNAPKSRDAVFADGSFIFYGPELADRLRKVVVDVLRPGGIYVGRHFVLPAVRRSVEDVMADARSGIINSFGAFKFRVAMALQRSESEGVALDDVWRAVSGAGIDYAHAGFPESEVSTIEHYRGKSGRLYFPSVRRLLAAFRKSGFSQVSAMFPDYEFGNCCPTVVATL